MPNYRDEILAAVDDLVSDFLYYDRKEDEDLPRDAIQRNIESGLITADEIVKRFESTLKERLG